MVSFYGRMWLVAVYLCTLTFNSPATASNETDSKIDEKRLLFVCK